MVERFYGSWETNRLHCVISIPIWGFSDQYFSAFVLNTEFRMNAGKYLPGKSRIQTLFTQSLNRCPNVLFEKHIYLILNRN